MGALAVVRGLAAHEQTPRSEAAGTAASPDPSSYRCTTHSFHGWDQPEVLITYPQGHEHAGEHRGLLRAWAVDDETCEWWGMCQYHVAAGVQLLDWVHEDHVRRDGDLDDDDAGRVLRTLPR